jgi:acyl carrier protein
MKIKEKVISIFKQVFDADVTEQTSQQDIEKWDSLGHLNLVVALEEEFDVSFEPKDITEMISVKINFIIAKKKWNIRLL